MRGPFAHGLEENLAVDPCSQDDCAIPPPARARAATPEARAWPEQNRFGHACANRLRRIAGQFRPAWRSGAGYRDPLFGRPDVIEDNYYRLRNQPRG